MDASFPAIVVPVEDQPQYYEVLDAGLVGGDNLLFFGMTETWVWASFAYWHALNGLPVVL